MKKTPAQENDTYIVYLLFQNHEYEKILLMPKASTPSHIPPSADEVKRRMQDAGVRFQEYFLKAVTQADEEFVAALPENITENHVFFSYVMQKGVLPSWNFERRECVFKSLRKDGSPLRRFLALMAKAEGRFNKEALPTKA